MENKIIIRWGAEDDAYIAEFPSFPGCMEDGKNVAEALQNLDRIKQEWRETTEKLGRKDHPTAR